MILSHERLLITIASSLLSLAVSFSILRAQKAAGLPLASSTIALTALLLGFYHGSVRDPSHGIGILILPVATGWLWWRIKQTGKPALAPGMLILLQLLVGSFYLLVVWWQEH